MLFAFSDAEDRGLVRRILSVEKVIRSAWRRSPIPGARAKRIFSGRYVEILQKRGWKLRDVLQMNGATSQALQNYRKATETLEALQGMLAEARGKTAR